MQWNRRDNRNEWRQQQEVCQQLQGCQHR
jgi:hypothetical protein